MFTDSDDLMIPSQWLSDFRHTIIEMHKADDAYGTGFYNNERWRRAYNRLREMVGMEPQNKC
jgi:hypothetical protein